MTRSPEHPESVSVDTSTLEKRGDELRCPVCEQWVAVLLVTAKALACRRCQGRQGQ